MEPYKALIIITTITIVINIVVIITSIIASTLMLIFFSQVDSWSFRHPFRLFAGLPVNPMNCLTLESVMTFTRPLMALWEPDKTRMNSRRGLTMLYRALCEDKIGFRALVVTYRLALRYHILAACYPTLVPR